MLDQTSLQAAGQARLDDLGRESVGRVHHLTVKDGELVVVTQYLLETDAQIPVGVRVVLVLALETDGLHGDALAFTLGGVERLAPDLVTLLAQQQIVHSTRERVGLEELGEETREDTEQLAGRLGSVDLKDGMDETVCGGTESGLVEHALQELSVLDDDLLLARVVLAPQATRHLGLGGEVEAVCLGGLEVEEHSRDDLLTSPERLGLEQRGRNGEHAAASRVLALGTQSTVKHLLVLCSRVEGVLGGHPHTGDDVVLDETTQRITAGGREVLVVGVGDVVALCTGSLRLRKMHVHLVTVEIGVVRVAVCVVHADRLLADEDAGLVGHHRGTMQRGLSVEQKDIAVAQMTQHLLVGDGRAGRAAETSKGAALLLGRVLLRREELVGQSGPLLYAELVELSLGTVFAANGDGTRVLERTVDDELTHELNVVHRDRLRIGELASKDGRNADLVGLDVDVGRDDGSCSKVDTLAHHVLSEETLLLFEALLDTGRRKLALTKRHGVLARVDERVDVDLKLHHGVEHLAAHVFSRLDELRLCHTEVGLGSIWPELGEVLLGCEPRQLGDLISDGEGGLEHIGQQLVLRVLERHVAHDAGGSEPGGRDGDGGDEEAVGTGTVGSGPDSGTGLGLDLALAVAETEGAVAAEEKGAERTLVVEEEAQMRLALDGGHDTVTGLLWRVVGRDGLSCNTGRIIVVLCGGGSRSRRGSKPPLDGGDTLDGRDAEVALLFVGCDLGREGSLLHDLEEAVATHVGADGVALTAALLVNLLHKVVHALFAERVGETARFWLVRGLAAGLGLLDELLDLLVDAVSELGRRLASGGLLGLGRAALLGRSVFRIRVFVGGLKLFVVQVGELGVASGLFCVDVLGIVDEAVLEKSETADHLCEHGKRGAETVAVEAGAAEQVEHVAHEERVEDGRRKLDVAKVARTLIRV
ncbi:hypothetical protein L1887_49105 [Cichorium endivia]|nr:hypothetical protein L1887_49105 [Cichorium endivia]